MLKLFAGCLLIAGLSTSAHADPVVIGYLPVTNQIEVVADELGFYKKEGLDVELKLFQTGPAAMQGLLSSDLQMVESAVVPSFNLAAQEVPLYYLVTGGINTPETPTGTIMVRTDETSLRTFADLKGRKIGQLGKGTITHLWLWNAAQRFGMGREDFQEIFVPFPQMGGLLASGQVDAVYAWPPFDTIITEAKQGRLLSTDTEWNPYSVVNVMTVRREWADKNEAIVRKLVKVAIETNRWIDDHPAEARAIIGKRLNLPEAVFTKMRMFYYPRNGYQLTPSIWDFYYLMVKSGQLTAFENPRAVILQYWLHPAARFITPVVDDLGRQDDSVVNEMLKIKLMNLPQPPQDYLAAWER
jgi:ABC-type nitrate/sulfonate/bicarbonate transport system substrate-binding protein